MANPPGPPPRLNPRTRWLIAAGLLTALAIGIALVWRRSPSADEMFRSALSGLERGDPRPAAQLIRRWEHDPARTDQFAIVEGVLLLRQGDFNGALRKLDTVPLQGPLRGYAMLYSARGLHGLNRLLEAEAVLRKLADEEPKNAEARRWLGIIYFDLGAYPLAIEELKQLTELAPEDFRPFRLIGLMYRDFEQNQEAIEAYLEALKRSPPPKLAGDIRKELAETLIDERRYEDARRVLSEAADTSAVQVLLARCDWNAGDAESALARLKIARGTDADNRSGALLEAEILAARGNREEALGLLKSAVEGHPFDAECHYAYGLALRDAGQTATAEVELKRWEELKGQATRLTELNFRALQEPYNAELRDELAATCDALGKPQLAAMWRQAAEACRTASRLRSTASPTFSQTPSGRE